MVKPGKGIKSTRGKKGLKAHKKQGGHRNATKVGRKRVGPGKKRHSR